MDSGNSCPNWIKLHINWRVNKSSHKVEWKLCLFYVYSYHVARTLMCNRRPLFPRRAQCKLWAHSACTCRVLLANQDMSNTLVKPKLSVNCLDGWWPWLWALAKINRVREPKLLANSGSGFRGDWISQNLLGQATLTRLDIRLDSAAVCGSGSGPRCRRINHCQTTVAASDNTAYAQLRLSCHPHASCPSCRVPEMP